MNHAIAQLPSHRRRRLIAALKAGLLQSPYSAAALVAVLGDTDDCAAIAQELSTLQQLGITGPAAGAWVESIHTVQSSIPQPDLVWSGPEVPGLHARTTSRVFEELIGAAKHRIWASTYAFFDGPKAFQQFAARMDALPDLRVTLLLNIQRRRGDTTPADHLVRAFADHFWSAAWPGTAKPEVYYDPRSLELNGPQGVLHAKALVVDDEAVLITSANLTEAAFERNIELGLLLRDQALAKSVARHFQILIDQQFLQILPPT